jgi:hypothetical protein
MPPLDGTEGRKTGRHLSYEKYQSLILIIGSFGKRDGDT